MSRRSVLLVLRFVVTVGNRGVMVIAAVVKGNIYVSFKKKQTKERGLEKKTKIFFFFFFADRLSLHGV